MDYGFYITKYDVDQLQEILKYLKMMDAQTLSTIQIVFQDKSILRILGGHDERVVFIVKNLNRWGDIITGRLLDTSVESFDQEIEFFRGENEETDSHFVRATVTKMRAGEVIEHYLKYSTLPNDTVWEMPPFK